MISHRLGSLRKLIHRCTNARRTKKNAQRETIARNLSQRMRPFRCSPNEGWEIRVHRQCETVYLPFADDARSLTSSIMDQKTARQNSRSRKVMFSFQAQTSLVLK